MEPRRFFEMHLRPNWQEWREDLSDERLAMNAVATANNMAEHALHYWVSNDPAKVYNCKLCQAGKYRGKLAEQECPDFAYVRDVADAHKHVKLRRDSRRLTGSDQIEARSGDFLLDVSMLDEGALGDHLVVVLDNGNDLPLQPIVDSVVRMWERLLKSWAH